MIKDVVDDIINKTKAELVTREKVYDGGFVEVYEEKYKLPNDKEITKKSIVKNGNKDASIVIARVSDDKYLLVFQNRINNIVSVEFPSGYIEENEDVITGSIREVYEETGYLLSDGELVDTFIPNIGSESSKVHIVYLKNVVCKNNQKLDDDEYINYMEFSFDEISYLINNNYIQSGGNKLAFFYLKDILTKENNNNVLIKR
ncbi:MAG: NUDIX hydrolase [Bacilli bacterium]|nr:NUDIX hydrolase [Bacilli bacterium]